ncbi:MAG: hypothetical protein QOI80_627, partial [Solirubrobacteraceae bacterium]|nr:hypothetical protein [Solirubrobacteraceae bacterium]
MKRLAVAAFVALALAPPATATAAPGSPLDELGPGPFAAAAPAADLGLTITDSQDPVNVNEQ